MKMFCPISHIPCDELEYPVYIENTPSVLYELKFLAEWYRRSRVDPCTRRVISWESIRPACGEQKKQEIILERIAHEMSVPITEAAAQVVAPTHSDLLAQIMESRKRFVEGFEHVFVVQRNGTLKCDKSMRTVVQVSRVDV